MVIWISIKTQTILRSSRNSKNSSLNQNFTSTQPQLLTRALQFDCLINCKTLTFLELLESASIQLNSIQDPTQFFSM